MKKSIVLFVILISVFSLTFNSCSSDDDESNDPQVATGSFEIYLDGVLFKQGTNAEVGLIKDNQGNYVNTVTIGMGSETGIVVSGFPTTISDVTTMDNDSDPGVNINVGSDYYGTISGTMTRTSASKISFDGTCTKLMEAQVYTITGFVQSTAWEVID
tara:strand:- start:77 stop:550 length:474 start_codon:yes stop_codon:yes gene_type:complete